MAALVVWAGVLARAAVVFAPDSAHLQTFNSDSALPVLMSNDPVIDPFRTYIYGQDQIGAWPFVPLQLVGRATGRVWTDWDVHLFQTAWLFLSVFAVAALARASRLAAPALFAATLCLHPTVSHYLFVINQRNAWQATAIFFAWWSLRRLCSRRPATRARGDAHDDTPARRVRARLALWSLSAFVFSLLAAWTSPLSGPALCAIFALEALRARALTHDDSSPRACGADDPFVKGRAVKDLLTAAAPLAAALVCEQLIKWNYHRHALKHYGKDFRTPVEIDWGHMADNLLAQLELFARHPQWPLTAVAVVAAPALAYRLLRRASALGRPGLRLDLSVLALGCLSVALVNLASTVVFSWTRLNSYGPRYLALTHLFGTLAGLYTLLLLFSLPEKIYSARRGIFPAVAGATVLLLALLFPPALKDPEYRRQKGVAAELARRAPRAVLLGGYWDTYVFAALHPRDAVTPVPAEDQFVRTPWSPRLLREAGEVVVVHHVFAPRAEIETPAPYATFGDGSAPPQTLHQHGATLSLVAPRWHEQDGYVFSLYRNERAGAR